MRYRLDRKTPFPQEAVFAWWTDFREDDHQHPGSPAASMRFVLRRTGNEIWLKDRATRPMRVTIQEHVIVNPPLGYAVEARYPAADVRYAYRFNPHDNGTLVTVDIDVQPRRLGWILVPLTAGWWRRYAARDLDYHLGEMNRELGSRT